MPNLSNSTALLRLLRKVQLNREGCDVTYPSETFLWSLKTLHA